MKRKLLFLLSLTLFTACDETDGDLDPSATTPQAESSSVSFTSGGIAFTRVTDNQFDAGNEILVKAYADSTEHSQGIYSYDGSSFKSDDPIMLAEGEALSYCAAYPSSAPFSGTFEAKADQSSAENYEASDLLVATTEVTSAATPELAFNHAMSSLILNVKVLEGGAAKSGSSVSATFSLKNQAQVDLASESYEATGSATTITPFPSVGNGTSESFNFSLIVAPQTIAANNVVATVVVDGANQFDFSYATDLTLQSGKQITYEFSVDLATKETSISFGKVISDWDDISPDEPEVTATWMLADFSATNYPTSANIWIIEDASASTDDFSGLKDALANCTNDITLRLPNLLSLPDNALTWIDNTSLSIELPVATTIGASALNGLSGLTTLKIPAATEIGEHALAACVNVASIEIPEATTIEDFAFMRCLALSSIDLPKATTIGGSAFYYCSALTTITLPEAITIEDYAFTNCTALTSIELPEATTIEDHAFYTCTALTSADLPKAITIGGSAFTNCTALTSIELPEATTIEDHAFYTCTALTSADLPKATTIGGYAFTNCTALTSIELPEATTIEDHAFYICTALTSADLPKATTIGGSAFYYCTALTSADFPKAITIGDYTFAGCTGLSSVELPEAITIEVGAFSGCTELTSINLPEATTIGGYAFSGCTALASVDLPEATTIGEYAFKGCTALASVDLPEATTIGDRAFNGCTALASVDLPEATTIGEYAFYECEDLTSIELLEAIEIGLYAFYKCTALSSVDLPAATTFGNRAFGYCTSLTTIELPEATTFGTLVFHSCSELTSINLPKITILGQLTTTANAKLTAVYVATVSGVTLDTSYLTSTTFLNSSAYTLYIGSANSDIVDLDLDCIYTDTWATFFNEIILVD
ncbi:MAG: leucine-rich repeat protein [Rikenellaceae bacterium]